MVEAKLCGECGVIHRPGENTLCPGWRPGPYVPRTATAEEDMFHRVLAFMRESDEWGMPDDVMRSAREAGLVIVSALKPLSARLSELEQRAAGVVEALDALVPKELQSNVAQVLDFSNAKFFDVRLRGVKLRAIVGVEVVAGELWAHLSVSAQVPARLPTWDELGWCKRYFLGDRKAIQVLPPKAEYVNIHPHVLNLYACLDRDPLPDFRVAIDATGRAGL